MARLEQQRSWANEGAPHLTLAQFANAKGFRTDFLTQEGVSENRGGLVFHSLLMNGQRAARQRIRLALAGEKRFIWNEAKGQPVPYGLWRLESARKRGVRELILCEGESDALTFWNHNIEALGIPGADMCKVLAAPHIRDFVTIIICKEPDDGGETFEKGCSGRLAALEFGGAVRVVEMARANCKDPNELHLRLLGDPGGFESEWGALVEQARSLELQAVGLEVFNAAAVVERPIEWLWPSRIPRGKLVLFVGPPGLGKSFASLYVVAQLSNGRSWPDGSANGIISDSIVFSAEDSIADTIVPRLIALEAERGHIILARRVREANEAGEINRRAFNLARDLPHLETTLDRNPNSKLVIVDPVSAFMSRVDTHKNAEVRSDVLDPLAELAERRGVTVLAVTHFNKGSGGNSLERVSGSVAFPAAARVVWGFARDPDDPGRRLMLLGKNNLGPEIPGLAFRIVGLENGRATIEWIAGEVEQKLDQVMAAERDQNRSDDSKLDQACALIRQICAHPIPVVELEARAEDLGISERTLKRARRLTGCVSYRAGGFANKGVWMVRMPSGGGDAS